MNTVVATVNVGEYPVGVSLTLDGTRAYVANSGRTSTTGAISVIDTETATMIGSILIGTWLGSVAMAPNGMAYVTVNGNNTMQVINTATNLVVGNVAFTSPPQHVAANPVGGTAYVIVGDDSVSVIDTTTNIDTGVTIGVGTTPQRIAFTPDGTRAYVSNINSGTISVIDATNHVVTGLITVAPPGGANQGQGPGGIVCSPDGQTLYVVNLSYTAGTLLAIDTDTNLITATVPIGRWSVDAAVSSDGATLYVTNLADDTVSVIDTATNIVIDTVDVGTRPAGLAVSTDGTTVYVTNTGDDTVSVMSAD